MVYLDTASANQPNGGSPEVIKITPDMSADLDRRVDQGATYREARIELGIIPVNAAIEVVPSLPPIVPKID